MSSKEVNAARKQFHKADAELNLHLEMFGDSLAKDRGWTYLLGVDAVRYYLMQKHHWTPAQLRAMSYEDLRFAVTKRFEPGPRQETRFQYLVIHPLRLQSKQAGL